MLDVLSDREISLIVFWIDFKHNCFNKFGARKWSTISETFLKTGEAHDPSKIESRVILSFHSEHKFTD